MAHLGYAYGWLESGSALFATLQRAPGLVAGWQHDCI